MAGMKSSQKGIKAGPRKITQGDINKVQQMILNNIPVNPSYLKTLGLSGGTPTMGDVVKLGNRVTPAKTRAGGLNNAPRNLTYLQRQNAIQSAQQAAPGSRGLGLRTGVYEPPGTKGRPIKAPANLPRGRRAPSAQETEYNKRFKPLPKTTTPRQRRPSKPFPQPPSRYP